MVVFVLNIAQCDFCESGAAVVASNPQLQSLYLEKNLSPQGQRGFEKTKARIYCCQALYKVFSTFFSWYDYIVSCENWIFTYLIGYESC